METERDSQIDPVQEFNRNNTKSEKAKSVQPVSHSEDNLSIKDVGEQVRDESGEVIEITQEFRDEALKVHGQIEGAFFQLANALYSIKEQKLYTALGFVAFRDYCKETLPFGVRSAYNYAMIGQQYGAKLLNSSSVDDSEIAKIGIRKLKLISDSGEEQVNSLISEGKIEVDEEEYTTEQLQKTTVNKLKQQLKKSNETAERAKELEYQKQLIDKENQDLMRENKELEQYKQVREIEQDIRSGLDQAGRHIENASRLITAMEVTDAPEHIQQEFVKRLDYFFELLEAHRDRNADLIYKHSQS